MEKRLFINFIRKIVIYLNYRSAKQRGVFMKSVYVKPVMISERFLPNEYVAACGDTEYGKYKFKCDAGGG